MNALQQSAECNIESALLTDVEPEISIADTGKTNKDAGLTYALIQKERQHENDHTELSLAATTCIKESNSNFLSEEDMLLESIIHECDQAVIDEESLLADDEVEPVNTNKIQCIATEEDIASLDRLPKDTKNEHVEVDKVESTEMKDVSTKDSQLEVNLSANATSTFDLESTDVQSCTHLKAYANVKSTPEFDANAPTILELRTTTIELNPLEPDEIVNENNTPNLKAVSQKSSAELAETAIETTALELEASANEITSDLETAIQKASSMDLTETAIDSSAIEPESSAIESTLELKTTAQETSYLELSETAIEANSIDLEASTDERTLELDSTAQETSCLKVAETAIKASKIELEESAIDTSLFELAETVNEECTLELKAKSRTVEFDTAPIENISLVAEEMLMDTSTPALLESPMETRKLELEATSNDPIPVISTETSTLGTIETATKTIMLEPIEAPTKTSTLASVKTATKESIETVNEANLLGPVETVKETTTTIRKESCKISENENESKVVRINDDINESNASDKIQISEESVPSVSGKEHDIMEVEPADDAKSDEVEQFDCDKDNNLLEEMMDSPTVASPCSNGSSSSTVDSSTRGENAEEGIDDEQQQEDDEILNDECSSSKEGNTSSAIPILKNDTELLKKISKNINEITSEDTSNGILETEDPLDNLEDLLVADESTNVEPNDLKDGKHKSVDYPLECPSSKRICVKEDDSLTAEFEASPTQLNDDDMDIEEIVKSTDIEESIPSLIQTSTGTPAGDTESISQVSKLLLNNVSVLTNEKPFQKGSLKRAPSSDDLSSIESLKKSKIIKCNDGISVNEKTDITADKKMEVSSDTPTSLISTKTPPLLPLSTSMKTMPAESMELIFIRKYKKSIEAMTRSDMEEMIALKIVESFIHKSELADLSAKCESQELIISSFRSKLSELSKQFRDLEMVHTRVIKDMELKNQNIVTPVKITRAVGLQVCLPRKDIQASTGTSPKSASISTGISNSASAQLKAIAKRRTSNKTPILKQSNGGAVSQAPQQTLQLTQKLQQQQQSLQSQQHQQRLQQQKQPSYQQQNAQKGNVLQRTIISQQPQRKIINTSTIVGSPNNANS